VSKVQKVILDSRDEMVLVVMSGQRVRRVSEVRSVRKVRKVSRESKAHRERQVRPVPKVPKAKKVIQEKLGHRDDLGHEVIRVLLVRLAHAVKLVRLVL
jgi:hypothetical protein